MKSNKGITLVALVITIIVLLILAGVSISLVVGDNGVLTQAQNASTKTDVASARSALEMTLTSVTSDFLGDVWSDNTSAKIYDNVTVYELDKELQNNGFYIVKFGGDTKDSGTTLTNVKDDLSNTGGDGTSAKPYETRIVIAEGTPSTGSHTNTQDGKAATATSKAKNTTYEATLEWTDKAVKIKKQTSTEYDKDLKEGAETGKVETVAQPTNP